MHFKKIYICLILIYLCFFLYGCNNKDNGVQNPQITVIEESNSDKKEIQQPNNNTQPYYDTYTINLDIDPQQGKITGIERVKFKNTVEKTLNEIYMNIYINAFSEKCDYLPYFLSDEKYIFPMNKEYVEFNILSILINNESVSFSLNNTILNIKPQKPILPNEEIEITIQFDSKIPIMTHYSGRGNSNLWLGNFIPSIAVYDKNGWNKSYYYPLGEPFYYNISNYDVTIVTPLEYVVAATGISESKELDGKKVTNISAKMVRDFAVLIGKNLQKDSIETNNGVTINLYYTDENYKKDTINEILNLTKKDIEYYTKNIGSYPYTQFNIVENDLYYEGDMQFSQIAFIDDSFFNGKNKITNLNFNLGLQWFKCIIGTDRVKENWLCEGFCEFLKIYIYYPPEQLKEIMNKEDEQLKEILENNKNSALLNSLSAYNSYEDYTNVQKRKSCLMIYKFYREFGEKNFSDFLQMYCSEYSFKNINSQDFINMCNKVYNEDLSEFFKKWINESDIPN